MEVKFVMRTKKVFINFVTDAFPQIVIMILGFLKIKLLLNHLGDETLGLYQLYGQIVSYLVLVEGGVGTAMLFHLYKPIHEKNKQKINEIMSASRVIFNTIGIIILVIGILISFNISLLIKENTFSNNYLMITFFVFLLSQILNYFCIPYRNMFDASQNRYIPNIIYQGMTIVKSIAEIIIVILGGNLMQILISLLICNIIANLLVFIIFKCKYKDISFKEKKDFSMISDVKHLFVNTIGGLVSNNIDILLISKFLGLKIVVIYTTYNYFVEAIRQLVDKITGATISGIGDMLASNEGDKKGVFNEYNNIVSFIAMIICTPLFICVNGFINVWYESKIVTSFIYSLLFSALLYLNIIRIPLKTFSLSSGKFAEIKKFVIMEIVINLVLSLTLIKKFGIAGVLFATIISILVADFIFKVKVVYEKIINEKMGMYYFKLVSNMIFTISINLIFYLIMPKTYSSVISCILCGLLIAFINLGFVTAFFYFTKQLNFLKRFKFMINFSSKRSKE